MKKRSVLALFAIIQVTLACSFGTPTAQPPVENVSTVVAATMQALTANAPTEAVPTQPSGTAFSFQNVSFVIPEGIGQGANAEVVPAANEDQAGPWAVAPEYISIELTGYPVANENEALHNMIAIFPASDYVNVNAGAAISIPRLQALLAAPSLPITVDNAPGVPNYNAAEVMIAQSGHLNFQSGSGVRFLTEYAQYPAAITKNGEIYQFTGLTNDGKYFIIAVFPIQAPLQSTQDNPSADGVTYPERADDPNAFNTYYQAMADMLNAAGASSFQPALGQLDALIQSIKIAP